jgi:hypothetical protein
MAEVVIVLGTAAAFLLGMLAVFFLGGVGNRAVFRQQFPPISDAEFLTRCTPGTDPTVALKVRRIVAEYFAVEYECVHPSMSFIEDIGAD